MDGNKTLQRFKKLHKLYKHSKRLGEPTDRLLLQLDVLDDMIAKIEPRWRKRAYRK
jgi:hypothetical protein